MRSIEKSTVGFSCLVTVVNISRFVIVNVIYNQVYRPVFTFITDK